MTEQGATAERLFDAISKGNELAVDTAVAVESSLLRSRDKDGRSPVVAAAAAGHIRLSERLAARLLKSPEGIDFFDASAVGNTSAMRNLLSQELAAVDDRGSDGCTALHHAARFGQLEAARLLLGRGADPNAVSMNTERTTPLHSAIEAKHRDTASLLLALGASPNAVQRGGWTPLHVAACNGDTAIVDMLLLRGADPTRVTDDGKTAIEMAEEGGHAALAKVLRTAALRR